MNVASPTHPPPTTTPTITDSAGPAITVQNLSKTYVDGLVFRKKFPALREVTFQVGRGEVFGLLGPNGAGKTTFLKILLGIIRKSGGTASLLGQSAGTRRGRRQVGYLPEQLRMPGHLTGFTALDYYGRLNGLAARDIRSRRDQLLDFVGLTGRGADQVTKYSKGMLQRLGLAQALLHQPELLVLDEPTDGLDPGARAEMRQLMIQLRSEGVTIFLNSHLLQEVEMVCDRVAILDRGHLRYCGTVTEIGEFINRGEVDSVIVQFELGGDEQDVRAALAGTPAVASACEIADCQTTPRGVRIRARLADQTGVDAAIDRLRAANISILAVERQTTSLEEAFLTIVGNDEPSAATPTGSGNGATASD